MLMRRPFTSTSLRRMTTTCGSVEHNELNQCLSLAIVIVGTLLPKCLPGTCYINEQLSRRKKEFVECYLLSVELYEIFFLPKSRSVYQRSVEINEQLSRRNSLNALCYRSNCVNSVVFQNWRLYVWEVDIEWIKIDDVDVLSLSHECM